MHKYPNVTMIVDLQYGSTGKGAIAGYLSTKNDYDTVISANMPNAGHTAYDHNGVKYVHKALPSGIFNNNIEFVMIGPGAVFDPAVLEKEVRHALDNGWLQNSEVLVHAMSVPVTPEMKTAEANSPVTGIASTTQGSLFAQIAKMQRDPSSKVVSRDAYTPSDSLPIRVISNTNWLDVIYMDSENILAEAAQGYSLGINSDFYPFCTSRDCGPARFLSDMALPIKSQLKIVGSMRTFPIRVGNTAKGHSGDCYPDQHEMTWDEVGVAPEMTTVTGRVRRVFSFSQQQFSEAVISTCCDEIFINFLNYLTPDEQETFILDLDVLARGCGAQVKYLGFGPKLSDVSEI